LGGVPVDAMAAAIYAYNSRGFLRIRGIHTQVKNECNRTFSSKGIKINSELLDKSVYRIDHTPW